MKHYTAIAPQSTETHLQITEVLDGDSIKVASIFGKDEKEIRLYGIDAPENKQCRKLREDEKKTQVAGEFLIHLGHLATKIVLKVAPPGTRVSLITEMNNYFDFYKRQLAYVILPDGSCLNEIMVREGYARAEKEYFCEMLSQYQKLNFIAKQKKSGLYALVKGF